MRIICVILSLMLVHDANIAQSKNTWQKVRKDLKSGEVVVDIARYAQAASTKPDFVNYLVSITTLNSKKPTVFFLKNANMLETKGIQEYLKSYGQDNISYEYFWQSIHTQLD